MATTSLPTAGSSLIPGGDSAEAFTTYPGGIASCGAFAKFPGATPKYAINDGRGRDAEYRETMARLFVQVPQEERQKFVDSCPPETRPLAQVLCGVGPAAGAATGFIDFLLTSVQETFQEKIQVAESLSDNFVIYTFGQRAPTFNYSGTLLNTYQDDQRVWMLRLYQDILRGTQLARRRKLARLRYDSVIVSGVFSMHTQTLQGDWRDYAQFQFSFIPTQYLIFTPGLGAPTTHNLDDKPLSPFTLDAKYQLSPATPADLRQFRVAAAKQASQPTTAPAAAQPADKTEARPATVNNAVDKLNERDKQCITDPATGLPATNVSSMPDIRGGAPQLSSQPEQLSTPPEGP